MHFKSLLDNSTGVSVCLEIGEDLPDNVKPSEILNSNVAFCVENYQSLDG